MTRIKLSNYNQKSINNKEEWNELLSEFNDASIYQTWEFPIWAQNEKRVEHLAFYENDNLIGLALARIRTAPIINWGIVYIYRGPICNRKNSNNDFKNLNKIIDILTNEFLLKRKHLIRFRLPIFDDQYDMINFNSQFVPYVRRVFKEEKTLLLDLKYNLNQIRASFSSKWRNRLNQAERNGINIISGRDNNLYNIFLELYEQLIKRKNFKEYVDPKKFSTMNQKQELKFRFQIFVAYKNEMPISALIGTAMGNTGIYLLGATSEIGMKNKAAYLLQWEFIKWLKENNFSRYDLGGIDSVNNHGVYEFKAGITKKEIQDFGIYEVYNSKLLKTFISVGEFIGAK